MHVIVPGAKLAVASVNSGSNTMDGTPVMATEDGILWDAADRLFHASAQHDRGLREDAELIVAVKEFASSIRAICHQSLDMCAHGADRGSYCGYCGGYSKGASDAAR